MTRRLFDDEADNFLGGSGEPEDPHIDFTPMIDCVVLLLGFFMVTSNLGGRDVVDVPVAKHKTNFPGENATIITVLAPDNDAAPPALFLGQGTSHPGDLGEGEGGVKGYVESRLREGYRHVIIRADREVPFGFVQEVMRTISAVEGASFSIGVRDRK